MATFKYYELEKKLELQNRIRFLVLISFAVISLGVMTYLFQAPWLVTGLSPTEHIYVPVILFFFFEVITIYILFLFRRPLCLQL